MAKNHRDQIHSKLGRSDRKLPNRAVETLAQRYAELLLLRKQLQELIKKPGDNDRQAARQD